MGFARFLWMWMWGAFGRSIGLGDFAAGIAGNFLTVVVHFYPEYETTVNDLWWQIPLYGLAGAMAWRILVTPYELWRNETEKAERQTRLGGQSTEVLHRFEPDSLADILRKAGDRAAAKHDEMRQEARERRTSILANPVPNIGLEAALDWVTEKTKKEGGEALAHLRDLASVGAISVWGRTSPSAEESPLQRISSQSWSTLWMETNSDLKTGVARDGYGYQFWDLRFCGHQIAEHFRRHRYRKDK